VPVFKHPCPYCDELIPRDAAACPYCGTQDPFAPKRCPSCRSPIEDLRWSACPRCGAALGVRPSTVARAPQGAAPAPVTGADAGAAPTATTGEVAGPVTAARPTCTGCGAALPADARFCLACGTLAG